MIRSYDDILLDIKEKNRIIGYWQDKINVAEYQIKQNKLRIQKLENESYDTVEWKTHMEKLN